MSEIHGREQEYIVTVKALGGKGPDLTFTSLEIPNFLRIARWRVGRRWNWAYLSKWCDVEDIFESDDFQDAKRGRVTVLAAKFTSVETGWCNPTDEGRGKYIPWADYEQLSPQPPHIALLRGEQWRIWLDEHDTEGDILSPRNDSTDE